MYFAPIVMLTVFVISAVLADKQRRYKLARLFLSLASLMVEILFIEIAINAVQEKAPEVLIAVYLISFLAMVFHGTTFFIDYTNALSHKWASMFGLQVKCNLVAIFIAIIAILA